MAAPAPTSLAEAHVVVAGVGGIGCPAAWGLLEAGVGRLTLVDPDLVAIHNLPRQVLFGDDDLGRRKAEVAAARLTRPRRTVRGVVERLDARSADALLAGAHLLVDATDGAHVKDGLNALAVARGLPLVHAAGLRSEARLLDVPAGGRPCLACLFGRLGAEGAGSCADFGVWNAVVGAVGFLAAEAAVRRLAQPRAPSSGYTVLDLLGRRWTRLAADAGRACPVCGPGATPRATPFVDDGPACAVPTPGSAPPGVLDLTRERCPMNLLRAGQALEGVGPGQVVELWLGLEGAATVPDGLRAQGHAVLVEEPLGDGLRLRVRRAWRPAADEPEPIPRDVLERFARQVVLPDFGEQGQRRLQGARVMLRGLAPGTDAARTYLLAAGVRDVVVKEGQPLAASVPGLGLAWAARRGPDGHYEVRRSTWIDQDRSPSVATPLQALVLGALLADTVERAIVLGTPPADLVSPPPPA